MAILVLLFLMQCCDIVSSLMTGYCFNEAGHKPLNSSLSKAASMMVYKQTLLVHPLTRKACIGLSNVAVSGAMSSLPTMTGGCIPKCGAISETVSFSVPPKLESDKNLKSIL